jgi:hypothetical protein
MNFMKRKPYRNRRLLDLAHKVNECQFRLPVCRGYAPEGCEPAHSNFQIHGKGKGLKSSDDEHCASCHDCHIYFDANKMPRDLAVKVFNEARERTFALYARMGWLEQVNYKGVI